MQTSHEVGFGTRVIVTFLLPAIILVQCWLLANRCESPQHDCCMWLCTKLDIIGHQAFICSLLGRASS